MIFDIFIQFGYFIFYFFPTCFLLQKLIEKLDKNKNMSTEDKSAIMEVSRF